jgi:hypothetical protein
MTFPSFITTGQTRDIVEQPLQHQPFNIMPLIQMLAKDEGKGKTSAPAKSESDFKLEGRIGAVNQVMEMYNKANSKINQGIDLYGTDFTYTPEYKNLVRQAEYAMSNEFKNIVARQTSDVKRFEENIKGKGHYYHLGQLGKTGDLKRMSDWKNIQEREYSSELGSPGGYIEDFDFDPIILGMEDARKAVDEEFKAGSWSTEEGWTNIKEDIVGNLLGVRKIYTEQMKERNYGLKDEKGNLDPRNLDYSEANIMKRAFANGFDFTDPISAGYFQGFLQRKGGMGGDPLAEYKDKKGYITDEGWNKLVSDFENFAKEDIFEERKEREITKDKIITQESFDEASEEGYNRYGKAKEVELANGAYVQNTLSVDALTDIGISMDNFFDDPEKLSKEEDVLVNKFGMDKATARSMAKIMNWVDIKNNIDLQGLNVYDVKDMMFSGNDSPFVINTSNGKEYVDINPNFNTESASDFKKLVMEKAKGRHSDPKALADQMYEKYVEKKNQISIARAQGRTNMAMGRNDINTLEMPTMEIPKLFTDAVNDSWNLGQTMDNLGSNSFGMIGESFIMMNNLGKNVKFAGTEGALTVTQNTLPTNIETIIKDEKTGKIIRYNWADPEWIKMSDEEKTKISQLADQQRTQYKNPMFGTAPRKLDGSVSEAIEKRIAVPMYGWAADQLRKAMNDPNANPNMIFASNAAFMQTAKLYSKSEADAAVALKDITVYKELPENYSKDKRYKERFDDIGYRVGNLVTRATRAVDYKDEAGVIAKELGYTGQRAEDFKSKYNKYINETSGVNQKMDFITNFDLNGATAWNYNNTKVIKTQIKAADGKKINPLVRNDLNITNEEKVKIGDKEETGGILFRIPMDVTAVTARNIKDKEHIKTFVGNGTKLWYERENAVAGKKNQQYERNANTTEQSKFQAIKPLGQ